MTETVLLTGASGKAATLIRPLLRRPGRTIRLLDLVPPTDVDEATETVITGSITDLDLMTRACEGVDLLVHFGGYSAERPWSDILTTNIDGAHTVLEAARLQGVQRALLASSIHAVGYVRALDAAEADVLQPRPDGYYGVSKVALEALGSLYADRFGMTIVSGRFGTIDPAVESVRTMSTWFSPADLARFVEAVAVLDEPGHHVVWGMSDNRRSWIDASAGQRIGFEPKDDAEAMAGAALRAAPRTPSADEHLAGVVIGPDYPVGRPW